MNKLEIKNLCQDIRSHFISRMDELCQQHNEEDAYCLYQELKEWIEQDEKFYILTLKTKNKI